MISTRAELNRVLRYEATLYPNGLFDYITHYQRIDNWRYIVALRKSEYYKNRGKDFFSRAMFLLYSRRRNLIGKKIGVEMWENTFDIGLTIHHSGSIVVSGEAHVGRNCQLHGDNCIGNSFPGSGSPTLGDNVDIGVGAKIIGNIYIADNIKIGANAVVTKSYYEPNITLVGMPARKVEK